MKKGSTLIEVLEAMFIFAMCFAVCMSAYLLSCKALQREHEYVEFETICYNINAYYDAYGDDWSNNYFTDPLKKPVVDQTTGITTYYYNASFELTDCDTYYDDKMYSLSYSMVNNELIITVKNNFQDYAIISELNFGGVHNE